MVASGYRDGPLLLERTGDGWHEVPWEWPGQTFFLMDVDAFRGTFWVVGDRYLRDGHPSVRAAWARRPVA